MKLKFHLLLTLLAVCILNISFSQTTVTYTESTEIFANPERGFHKYSITDNNYHNVSSYTNLDQATLNGWRNDTDKVTVLHRIFLLDAFINSSISATYLSNMQQDFDVIRNSGMKCIIRFVYSLVANNNQQQASKSRILQHIGQIAPVISLNKDVILCYQAGFIGTWGEWYYTNSTEFGDQETISSAQWSNRKDVVDSMLASSPLSIPIQLRSVVHKNNLYGSVPLDNQTAYSNTAVARIGFYNDAFLNSWGDMNTYIVNSEFENPVGNPDYVYLSNETSYTPMSGETNGLNSPRTDGSNAILELDSTNWSTLNRDFFSQNFDDWYNSGDYEDIARMLGYRISLINSTFSNTANNLSINIKLKNSGFARAFKKRNTYLLLKNSASSIYYSFLLNTDFRTWEDTINIVQTINLSGLPNGNYAAFLKLPDIEASLANRPEYSVRLANTGTWIQSLGINDLSQSFTFINTGVANSTGPEISTVVFPNPTNGEFQVESKETIDNIELFDLVGRIIPIQITYAQNTINVATGSYIQEGTYILKSYFKDKVHYQKIVIRH